jgi:Spy/CpxP family protein refolding chaperone
MKFPRYITCLLLPGLIALTPLTLKAQTATPESANHPQLGKAPRIMQGRGASGIEFGGPAGVLTEQQRTSYETALSSERGRINELQTNLRAARQDFLATSLSQKFDENVLRQKALAVGRFEADLAVLRAKALSQIQPPLSADQIEKIKAEQAGRQPLRGQQFQRPGQHAATSGNTNQDANGLPPKK